MLILGTQYYRPPTPDRSLWEADIRKMKEAGLNTIQLWAVWGWIEPEPGRFVFDDYDALVDLADQNGMQVVISTITDLQPFWIPRLYPGTHMVDARGNKVVGTPRQECLPGLTPGHCTDHEEIRNLSMRFMRELASHYSDSAALHSWDCWNETRWCVCCEHWVCYCEASIRSFRGFLEAKYGDLGALGEAWGRRLVSWEDVRPPQPVGQVNPGLLDFGRWLIHRAKDTAHWRRQAIREGDPNHPVTAHAPCSVARHRTTGEEEAPFARGNDFDNALEMDAYGTSAFPAWWFSDPTDLGITLEATRSVAHPKPFWLSELQGGAFNQGFEYGLEVAGALQQYWTWSAYGRGAEAVIYWCWRDEIWGVESGGYGIIGQDGCAEDRVAQLQVTARLLQDHEEDLDAYEPDPPLAGVVFDSDSVLLAVFNRQGNSEPVTCGVNGTMAALERCRIPFALLDGRDLSIPKEMGLLVVPGAFCLKPQAAEAIQAFMERGGWVFCEAGTGMFTDNGFYRADASERPLVGALGIRQGRRRHSRLRADCALAADSCGEHASLRLGSGLWSMALEPPSGGRVLAQDATGDAMLIEVPVGKGGLVMSGTFPAYSYGKQIPSDYAAFLRVLAARAGAVPSWQVESEAGLDGLSVRTGTSGKKRLCFLLNGRGAKTLRVTPGEPTADEAREWVTGEVIGAEQGAFTIELPAPGHRVLEWSIP